MNQRDLALEGALTATTPPVAEGRGPGLVEGQDALAYWRVIRRYLAQIVALAIAVGLLSGLFAYSLEPVYQAKTTLLIDSNRRGYSPVQDDPVGGWYSYLSNQTYLQTQILLLQSEALAENVAERLSLWTHPELDPRQDPPRRARFQLRLDGIVPSWAKPSEQPPPISEDHARRAVVKGLVAGLKAEQVPDSDIVSLAFSSHDAELAAKVVAAYADAYVELGLETRLEQVKKAASWLTNRLDGLREQVETSERKLQSYREKQGLVDMEGTQDLTDNELADLSSRLVEARAKREGLRNEFEQVQRLGSIDSSELSAHPVVLRNSIIQTLKGEEVRAERDASEMAERYGAQHPKMVAARSDLNTIRAKLRAEINNTIAGIKKEYDIANSRATQLEQELDRLKGNAQEVNRKEFTLRSLKRDVETNRQIYDTFLTRFKETDLGADVESTNARVIDVAQVPQHPIKPRKVRIIALGVLLALMLGIALAFLEDYLDNTLKSAEDVEHHTQLANLGTVPLLGRRGVKKAAPERTFLDSPKSDFAEAVRTVRTGVVLSGLDDPHRILLVTSTVPGEGKTTIAINLAAALSQLERVLLVDGDMRRSSVGVRLGLPADAPGLSNLVAGSADIDACVHPLEGTNLSVLPAGLAPPNPLELLSSQRFAQTLADLEQRFDRIVLDSAPAQAVSDSLVLSRLCNAVVFVIKADATPRQLVQLALRRLRRVDAPVIGAVLNQFDGVRAARYGHYHYGRYRRYSYAYHGYTQYYRDSKAKG